MIQLFLIKVQKLGATFEIDFSKYLKLLRKTEEPEAYQFIKTYWP